MLVIMNADERIDEMGRTFNEYLKIFNITLNRDVDFVRGEGECADFGGRLNVDLTEHTNLNSTRTEHAAVASGTFKISQGDIRPGREKCQRFRIL